MLHLREPIAIGRARASYVHPDDPTRAIRIPPPGQAARTRREVALYRRLERRGVDYADYLPRFYGICETSLGTGLVFDLVRDFDGQASRALSEYLDAGYPLDDFEPAFDELRALFLRDLILFDDALTLDALLFRRTSLTRGRLVATAGLVDGGWLDRIPHVARRRIDRRWRRLRLDAEYARAAQDEHAADETKPGAGRAD